MDSDMDIPMTNFKEEHIVKGISPTKSPTCLELFQETCSSFVTENRTVLKYIFLALLLAGYCVYLVFAVLHDAEGALALLVITALVNIWIFYRWVVQTCGKSIQNKCFVPLQNCLRQRWHWIKWILYPVLTILVIWYIALILQEIQQIQSLLGMFFCLLIPYLTCKHPSQIRWRPVIWGLALQFLLGVLTLRWKPGYHAMQWASDQINTFLKYAFDGASLAFGDPFFLLHPLVMAVFPIVIYVGAVTGLLYYLGVIQACVQKMSFFMRITLGTTGVESVNIVLNIFLSVAETATMMKPYLPKLTASEFHTLIVGSHASIAGFAYPLFVLVGVDGRHLLTASIMSAPAAVAISKLSFPETEESLFKSEDDCDMDINTFNNPGEAMSDAAQQAGKTCLSLLVQIVAFFSIYAFLDVCVAYLGSRVGIELSFEIIFSTLFHPVAYMLGVDWAESDKVASIVGLKLTISEILGYLKLGSMRSAQQLTERASMLTTYAICGFSSFGTLAIFVGVWATVVPSRATEMARLVPRVYLNTNISCFLTACVAGILYSEDVAWAEESAAPARDISKLLQFLPSYKTLLEAIGY